MVWIIYCIIVLIISGVVGLHLRRFRDVYTEMTGMMVGMTMGMLNGFVLGFAAAGATEAIFRTTATVSLFWGNLVGILLGIGLGAYFGRAGGLMGMMDGGMGGVMGGSMGAMLMAMIPFPAWATYWTAALLTLVYLVGMFTLVVLIERSAPGYGALHRLAPWLTSPMRDDLDEEVGALQPAISTLGALPRIDDYYEFLGVESWSTPDEVATAYLSKLAEVSGEDAARAERAYAILTDPVKRQVYDAKLRACCPPKKKKVVAAEASITSTATAAATGLIAQPAPTTQPTTAPTAAASQRASGSARSVARVPRTQTTQAAAKGANKKSSAKSAKTQEGSYTGIIVAAIVVLAVVGFFGAWAFGQAVRSASAPPLQPNNTGLSGTTDNGLALPSDLLARIDAEATVARQDSGVQTLDVIVNGDTMSYKPNAIKVKQGVPVHFDLRVEGRDPG